MAAGYSFRPSAWRLLLAGAACAAAIALGHWQSGRAAQRTALGARLDAALRAPALELSPADDARNYVLQHVAVRGSFVERHTVLLDNRLRGGRPGYEVVTPLRLAGSDAYVLVERGWIAAGANRERPPEVRTPGGELRVDGLGIARLPRALQAGAASGGKVRQNLDIDGYAKETGLHLLPLVIEQRSAAADGLLREWPRPDFGVAMNRSYALQWYSFAVLAVALGLIFSFRRVAAP
jgi:surfeit locus 1 family protein